MEKITIETTQNVHIEYEVGNVGDRIVATIIDLLIMLGYCLAVVIIFTNTLSHSFGPGTGVLFFVLLLPVMLYSLLFEVFMNGQTPGKRAMKIKVMRMDGRQPGFGNYLMRWILRLVDIWMTDGVAALITILINGKGQRLGDLAAGTLVIKLRAKQQISNTAFERVDEKYVPVFPEATMLSDKDASTIRQVLNLTINDVEDIAILENKLADKLKTYLNVKTTLGDRQFLQTILKDYNMISGRL